MAVLFFAVLFLIVYGSLYPFDFTAAALAPESAGGHFFSWNVFSSRGDVLGNVALFVPYGFVGMLALPSRRPFAANFIPLAIFGIFVAVGVQILQLFLPARDAVLSDVLWNMLGMIFGAWMTTLPPVRQALRGHADLRFDVVPALLVGCWVAAELAPFVPSIDLQSFKDSLKPLLLAPELDWLDFFRAFVAWLIVGYLADRSFARPPAWLWLAGGVCGLLAAKVVVVQNVVTVADVAAAAAALLTWLLVRRRTSRRPLLLLALLAAYMATAALEPFNLRADAQAFAWLPFSGSLSGSMLINAKVIAEKFFLIGSVLYLAAQCGFPRRGTVILVAASLAILETAQIWIGEHTPEITDPLLALLLSAVLGTLHRHQAVAAARRAALSRVRQGQAPSSAPAAGATAGAAAIAVPHLRRADDSETGVSPLSRHGVIMLAAGCVAIVVALQIVLGLPKIPYNVRDLFGGENAWWKLVVFALAVLSIGIGGALAGHATARSRHPYLVLPGTAILACLATYLLLAVGTSVESIEDIAGSSNTYFFVTQRQMWGDGGIWLYQAIGSEALIGAVERVVRFVALFGPLMFWLAIVSAGYFRMTGDSGGRSGGAGARLGAMLVYVLCGLPWLILFKMIAFDYSSTDNLNELIEDNGAALYGLLILLPVAAAAVVHASRTGRARDIAVALVVTAVSLPLGWVLLENGLAPEVHKYGHVFSGVDFLLGPDREELLPASVLMLRWFAVQLAAIATLAYGMRIVMPPARRVAEMATA
jgi:VanZ family protein